MCIKVMETTRKKMNNFSPMMENWLRCVSLMDERIMAYVSASLYEFVVEGVFALFTFLGLIGVNC